MSFATPFAWFLALAAVPIIVFYILKLRLRRLTVSTNLFWRQIYDEKPPRSIWQYLKHLLSLLVQLLLVALLAAAVADPYFAWQRLAARRIVVVVDNSASMRASDVNSTRLEAAIDSATSLVDGLRFRDEMAIVLAGPRPEVLVGMSDHAPTLKRVLKAIAPTDNPTNVASAIELGQQLIGGHPHGEVVVFSDGCWENEPATTKTEKQTLTPGPSPETGEGGKEAPIANRIFAAKTANVGITQFQVRRSLVDPLGYEVLVMVRNAGPEEVKCRVELELAGAPVDILPLTLKPEETWRRSLEKTSLEGGHLTAKLTQVQRSKASSAKEKLPLNALATDDTAYAVLPARQRQRVLLVTAGNLFLQKVFEANPLVEVEVRKDFPAAWPKDAIIVLHREVPPKLPAGNLFVVDPAVGCDAWDLGEVIENPIVTELDKTSPLMTHVRLDNVLMPEARRLNFKTPPKVLAGSLSNEPIYAELTGEGFKRLVLTVNLDRGDLAFRTAFPIMVANSLGWFAGESGELRESLATGAITSLSVAKTSVDKSESLSLRSPGGKTRKIAYEASQPSEQEIAVTVGPFDECGVWRVTSNAESALEPPLAELAVNLSSPRETDLRPPEELLEQSQRESSVANWLARPLWFYLLFSACALFVTEWLLYQRRVIA